MVESLANAGVLGGHYADNNHLSVLPALVAGGVFALAALASRGLDLWSEAWGADDWVVEAAKSFSKRSPVKDLPGVFPLQMLALFVMESAEQLVSGGTLLGGTVWLGGPIFFSLFAHAMVGAGCLFALAAFMRGLLSTLASFVRAVARFIWLAIAQPGRCYRFGRRTAPLLRAQAAHVSHIGGRAPPLLLTPA